MLVNFHSLVTRNNNRRRTNLPVFYHVVFRAYVPPAPTRYVDSYATADNNAQSGYQPQTPGMAPAPAFENQVNVYGYTTNSAFQNPLPATFVSAEQPAAASYSSETTRTDEVR